MRFAEWEPIYLEIVRDFGYDIERDLSAARLLIGELRTDQILPDTENRMKSIVKDASFVLLGPCISIEEIEAMVRTDILPNAYQAVSVGRATELLLGAGLAPTLVFTDLDGGTESDIEASERGSVAIIHAHGDNMPPLREWVPKFSGPVVPTCQCRPFEGIFNWGGFTDGDRAYCALHHFMAREIRLVGFDFEEPCGGKTVDPSVKRRKLGWAKRIIDSVNAERARSA